MRKRIWFLLLGSWLTFHAYAAVETPVNLAWKAIQEKQYSDAENLLIAELQRNPDNHDARYLLAKAYAWNDQIDRGIEQLDLLLKIFPDNSDFLFSKATFLSWQNNISSAIELLNKARKISPDYQDIWKTELTLRQRQMNSDNRLQYQQIADDYAKRFGDTSFSVTAEENAKTKSKRAIGFGYRHEQLSNQSSDWHETYLNFSGENSKRYYNLQADFYRRFKTDDQQLSLHYLKKNFYNFILNSYASFSVENKLLPTWAAAIQANKSIFQQGNAELSYQHNRYTRLNADILRIAYSHSWKQFEPKIHMITTVFNNQEYALGLLTQITYNYSEYTLARISASKNTEVEYLPTEQTLYHVKTVSLDGRTKLPRNWDINLALTHHIQGKAYSRNGIHTGLLYRF